MMRFIVFGLALALSALPVFGRSVLATWWANPSTDGVTNYVVHWGTASGVYSSTTNTGTGTNCVVSGLEKGLTYYFAVTAVSSDGLESDPSDEVSIYIPRLPAKVRGVAVQILTNSP